MKDDTKAHICLEILSIIVMAPFEAFQVQTGTNAEGSLTWAICSPNEGGLLEAILCLKEWLFSVFLSNT